VGRTSSSRDIVSRRHASVNIRSLRDTVAQIASGGGDFSGGVRPVLLRASGSSNRDPDFRIIDADLAGASAESRQPADKA
jgi:hypothetical protein